MAINALTTIEQQYTIISDVHKGLAHDPKAKKMASHRGNFLAIQKISNRFFWYNIKGDVKGGREFVNEVSKALHNMVGTEQLITLTYHTQENGRCERQNRTIKDS